MIAAIETPSFLLEPLEEHLETYCGNLACDCHTNVGYHQVVTDPLLATPAEDEIEMAIAFLGGRG